MSAIAVVTKPLSRPYPCRAFYDTIGDTLSAGIKQRGSFKHSLEGDDCSFDLTRDGRLLNIDIWKPRREWRIETAIHPPEEMARLNIALLTNGNGRGLIEIDYLTDAKRSLVNIKFSRERVAQFVSPATSLIIELNEASQLAGIWLLGIIDDINFQKEGEWRRSIKAL